MPQSKKKITVLQVLPRLETGGVERGTIEVAKALIADGSQAIVVSAGGKWASQIDYAGGVHVKLPVASKNPITILFNSWRIARVIKQYDVDIVHARSRAPAWSAYLASKMMGCHFMTTFHGMYSLGKPLKRFYNSIMLKGARVIAVSEYVKDHIVTNYGDAYTDKLRVIHRGVDVNAFDRTAIKESRVIALSEQLNIEHDRPIILLPGRFSEWKGHIFLLEALRQLDTASYECLFVGGGRHNSRYCETLETLINAYGLTSNVRMIGSIDDMPALYSIADIVVSAATSRAEAFGRISVESQAMERLTVATDHGGSSETIIDQKTGWLVTPGDVDQLARTLKEALTYGPRKRATMVKAARKRAQEHFSMTKMVADTLTVYKELV